MNKTDRFEPQINNVRSSVPPNAYPALPTPSRVVASNSKETRQSYAAYLEANYDLTNQLTVTLSGRYAYERMKAYNVVLPTNWKIGDPLAAPLPDPRGSFAFHKFTPRAVLRYKPDNNNTFYASYSQGFKGGGVNQAQIDNCSPYPTCLQPPIKPETVTAYEIGYKGRLWDRLTLTLAGFHYLYNNIQVFIYNVPTSIFENAATGRIDGGELSAEFNATPEITLNAGVSYLDNRYTSYAAATVYIPNGNGYTQTSANASGHPLERTPKWTANGSINYDHKFSGGELGGYVGANYNSGYSFDPIGVIRQKAYALVDAQLFFAPARFPGTRVVLWGENLTNHPVIQGALTTALAAVTAYAPPRTFGVKFEYRF